MQLGIYFDQTRCVGCYTCAVACKDWHDVPLGDAQWLRVGCLEEGVFPNLFVAYLAQACFHCENPACVEACPAEAISKREADGIVVVDRKACQGLETCGGDCLEACPYGAPQFGPQPDDKMQKCDLCQERWQEGRKPICVEACPLRALDAGPLDELLAKYGQERQAVGFDLNREIGPSVVFKPKPRTNPS